MTALNWFTYHITDRLCKRYTSYRHRGPPMQRFAISVLLTWTLKTKSCHNANFVIPGGASVVMIAYGAATRKSWHHNNFRISMDNISNNTWNEYCHDDVGGGWGCEVSCGGHHRPRGKTTTGSALDGAVFDLAQILAYLVHSMSRSQLYLGFGHFGWLPSFFGQ